MIRPVSKRKNGVDVVTQSRAKDQKVVEKVTVSNLPFWFQQGDGLPIRHWYKPTAIRTAIRVTKKRSAG